MGDRSRVQLLNGAASGPSALLGITWYTSLDQVLQLLPSWSSGLLPDRQKPFVVKQGPYHFGLATVEILCTRWLPSVLESYNHEMGGGTLLQCVPPSSPLPYGFRLYFDIELYVFGLENQNEFEPSEMVKLLHSVVVAAAEKVSASSMASLPVPIGDNASRLVFKFGQPQVLKQSHHLVYEGLRFSSKAHMKFFVKQFVHDYILGDPELWPLLTYVPPGGENRCVCVDLAVYNNGYQAMSVPFSTRSEGGLSGFRRPWCFESHRRLEFNGDDGAKMQWFLRNLVVQHGPDLEGSTIFQMLDEELESLGFRSSTTSAVSSSARSSSSARPPRRQAPGGGEQKVQVEEVKADVITSTSEEKRLACLMVSLLSPTRADTYSDWTKVGWVLKSVFGTGDHVAARSGLWTFLSFSAQNTDKFNEQECIRVYNAGNGTIKLGSLVTWAKQDSPVIAAAAVTGSSSGFRSVHVEPHLNNDLPASEQEPAAGPQMPPLNFPVVHVAAAAAAALEDTVRVHGFVVPFDEIIESLLDRLGRTGVERLNFDPTVAALAVQHFQERWTRTAAAAGHDDSSGGDEESFHEGEDTDDEAGGAGDAVVLLAHDGDDGGGVASSSARPRWDVGVFRKELGELKKFLVFYLDRFFTVLNTGQKVQILEREVRLVPSRIWRNEMSIERDFSWKTVASFHERMAKSNFVIPTMLEKQYFSQSTAAAIAAASANPKTKGVGGSKRLESSKLWRHSLDIPDFNRAVFEPDPSMQDRVQHNRDYNLYEELGCPHPKPGEQPSMSREDLKARILPILDHLCGQICNESECIQDEAISPKYNYLVRFLAAKYKSPWLRMEVCLVFIGPQGTGKTYVSHLIGAILGQQHYIYMVGGSPLKDEFQMAGKEMTNLLRTYDEFTKLTLEEQARLKAVITAEVRIINEKFLPKCEVVNRSTTIIITNDPNALLEEPEARRFWFSHTRDTYGGPATPESQAYFNELFGVSYKLFAMYLFWYVDTDGFDPRIMPWTKERQENLEKIVTRGDHNSILKWVLHRVHCPFDALFDGQWHQKDVVFEAFRQWKEQQVRRPEYKPTMADSPLSFMSPNLGPRRSSSASNASSLRRQPSNGSDASSPAALALGLAVSFWCAMQQLFASTDSVDHRLPERSRRGAGGDRKKEVHMPSVSVARSLLDLRLFAHHQTEIQKDWRWKNCTEDRHHCEHDGSVEPAAGVDRPLGSRSAVPVGAAPDNDDNNLMTPPPKRGRTERKTQLNLRESPLKNPTPEKKAFTRNVPDPDRMRQTQLLLSQCVVLDPSSSSSKSSNSSSSSLPSPDQTTTSSSSNKSSNSSSSSLPSPDQAATSHRSNSSNGSPSNSSVSSPPIPDRHVFTMVGPVAVPVGAPAPAGARAALPDPPEITYEEEHEDHEPDHSQEPAEGSTEPQEHQEEVEQDSVDSMHETEVRTLFNEAGPMPGSDTDSESGANKASSVDGEQESPGTDTDSDSELERTTAEESRRPRAL